MSDTRKSFLNTPINRRRLLGAGAGLSTALALGGRSPRWSAAQAAQPVVPAAAAGELPEQEIRILIFSGPEADAHTRLAPQFTEYTQGKVKVVIEEGGRDADYNSKWLAAAQSRSDAYDVLHNNAELFLRTGPAGFFEPLEPFMADPKLFNAEAFNLDDFPASLLDLFRVDGKLFLLPQEASTLMFYYRKDLLAQYGVPEPPPIGYSWDELRAHALKIQTALTAEGKADTYALIFGVKPPSHAGFNMLQPVWSTAHEFFTPDKQPAFDQPQMAQAVTMMTDFLFKDKVVSPGIVGYEYPEVLTAYQQGNAAMALQWNAAAPTILDPTKSPAVAAQTGFSVYPYDAAVGPEQLRVYPSVHAIGVSPFSTKKEAAFAYVAWFTSPEIARDYVVNGGGSSGRESLLSDPEIVAKNPQYPSLLEGFKLYHPLPQISQWSFLFTDIVGANAGAVWTGQVSVEEGLKAMQDEATEYLTEEGVI